MKFKNSFDGRRAINKTPGSLRGFEVAETSTNWDGG